MELPLDLLRTLPAAVDAGTLDGAAKRLSMTPSAVSQRLRQLEARVGLVLLTRTKPVAPTPDGRVLLRLAREIALLEHAAIAELHLDQSERTVVHLGVNADSLLTWFMPALAQIASTQDVLIEVHREDQERTAHLLESGAVMGAVTAQATPVPGCKSTPLGKMRYGAYASREFVARWFPAGITPDTLRVAPKVDFDAVDVLQRQWLRSVGVPDAPRGHIVSASAEYAKAIELGLGWGMILPSTVAELGHKIVRLSPGDGGAVEVPLYWQRWNLASGLLEAITTIVVAAAARSTDLS